MICLLWSEINVKEGCCRPGLENCSHFSSDSSLRSAIRFPCCDSQVNHPQLFTFCSIHRKYLSFVYLSSAHFHSNKFIPSWKCFLNHFLFTLLFFNNLIFYLLFPAEAISPDMKGVSSQISIHRFRTWTTYLLMSLNFVLEGLCLIRFFGVRSQPMQIQKFQ